jgi:hypothetical protein
VAQQALQRLTRFERAAEPGFALSISLEQLGRERRVIDGAGADLGLLLLDPRRVGRELLGEILLPRAHAREGAGQLFVGSTRLDRIVERHRVDTRLLRRAFAIQ